MAQKKNPPGKKPSKTEDDDTKETQEGSEGEETNEDEDSEDDAEAENRRINAIVTSRVKREMKGVLATLAQLGAKLDGLAESKSKKDEEQDHDEDEDSKKETQVDPKLSRKLTKMEKELADERAARQKAEKERAEEQERSKRNEMRSVFSSALSELGVTDPKLLRAALNVLEEDGVMIRDEDGKVKFKGQDKYGIETNFDPKVGLKSWVAGEGKSFVPAVDAGGSGQGGARGTGNGTQALSARDLKKMSPQQIAAINLERACSGLPPLGTEE